MAAELDPLAYSSSRLRATCVGSRLRRLIIAAGVAEAVILASGRAAGPTWTLGAAVTSAAVDPNQSAIMKVALSVAKANGDPFPTSVDWVHGKRSALAKTMGFGGRPADDANVQVLIVMHGSFTAPVKHGPPGLPADQRTQRGSVITLLINSGDLSITDYGIGNESLALSTLGTVYSTKS